VLVYDDGSYELVVAPAPVTLDQLKPFATAA